MRSDHYIKFLLTIIAVCLMALVFRSAGLIPRIQAATVTTCTGEMKATSASPMQASLGASYKNPGHVQLGRFAVPTARYPRTTRGAYGC